MLSAVAIANVWVVVMLVTAPIAMVCGTVIVLVLAVSRRDRVEVIKALPPLVHALGRQVGNTRRHGRSESRCTPGQAGIDRISRP
jgi:hypothetical protein